MAVTRSQGTTKEGPGGPGTRIVAKRYPVEEGLEAGTTKQSDDPIIEGDDGKS